MNNAIRLLVPCFLTVFHVGVCCALDFFEVKSIKYADKPPRRGFALYREVGAAKTDGERIFLPFITVEARTRMQTRAESLYAKAYYYDRSRKLIGHAEKPYPVARDTGGAYPMPVFFPENKYESLYFAVPANVRETPGWQVLVVFGDEQAAAAAVFPRGMVAAYDFPERPLVMNLERGERKAAMDPVVEHVIKTRNEKQPQITLFMRPPVGMTDAAEARGVLAMCLLAGSVGDIKRRLQELEARDDVGAVLRFAEKHKLVILCWGSRSLWNPRANWDEQSKLINKQMDETFDDVAKAWAKGVAELARKYGIPEKGFLLWGMSGSAQYAARLALRQPEYFLAIHVHVPSSFDKPTPEANQVLWCLTTGECESGYQRSLRFFDACRELGYPIIYKAIPGLGHAGHPLTEKLGLDFFEYALSVRDEKAEFEAELGNPFSSFKNEWRKQPNRPWPESFRNPAFVGDVINQEIFRYERVDMVPEPFRIMLPTRELAAAWDQTE